MPLKRPPAPKWPEKSSEKADRHAGDYKRNLKKIAEALARQEHSEYVLERHVDAAVDSLAKLGLTKWRFWKRPEFQVGCGSFLIGIAWIFPDLLPVFFDEKWLKMQGITIACIAIPFFVGSFLAIHGWYRAAHGE